METERWLENLFRRIDEGGVQAILDDLHEDVSWRFGSFPPGEDRASFASVWESMAPAISSLHHELIEWWETDEHVLCRGEVTYGLHDGREARFPFLNVFRMREGRIAEYLIYVDASAVFGSPAIA